MESDLRTIGQHERIKLSRFCHVFERGGVLCLYHALGISPIFFGSDFAPMLSVLRQGAVINDLLAPSSVSREQTADLLIQLRTKRFLIVRDAEDERQLAEVQARYLGHPSVAVMYLLVTDACNLSCSYCFVKNNMPSGYHTRMMTPGCAQTAGRKAICIICICVSI